MAAASPPSFARGTLKPKPMILKDLLREDLRTESFRTSQTQQTTVRYLLEVEFKKRRATDIRETLLKGRRSKSPLSRISVVLSAVRILPFVSSATSCSSSYSTDATKSKRGILPRSFSRRLFRGSLWTKRAGERTKQCSPQNSSAANTKERMFLRDIIRQSSFADETRGEKPIDLHAEPSPSASPVAVSSGRNSCSCSSSGWSEGVSLSTGSDSLPSPFSPDMSSDFAKPVLRSPEKSKVAKTTATVVCSPISGTEVTERPTVGVGGDSSSTATATAFFHDAQEEEGSKRLECACNQYEHNDEYSPISVMDFPYEAEEEPGSGAATPPSSVHHTLAKLDSGRHHLPRKIRRFKTIAHLADPSEPEDCSATITAIATAEPSDDDDADLNNGEGEEAEQVEIASALVEQVRQGSSSKRSGEEDECEDLLLLHFFIEGLNNESARWKPTCCVKLDRRKDWAVVDELLCMARDWIDGIETFSDDGTGARGGIERQIEEIERHGRWRCFHADQDEIALELECRVMGSLVEELSHELLNSGC